MTRYKMDDGTVVDTKNAAQSWSEATWWDGRNHISKPTGSQWEHQGLYKSRRGRYYLEHWSQRQGSSAYVEWISKRAAAAWLLENGHEIPPDLASEAQEVAE